MSQPISDKNLTIIRGSYLLHPGRTASYRISKLYGESLINPELPQASNRAATLRGCHSIVTPYDAREIMRAAEGRKQDLYRISKGAASKFPMA